MTLIGVRIYFIPGPRIATNLNFFLKKSSPKYISKISIILMFKLPQNTILGKRNHSNKLDLPTRTEISTVTSSVNGNYKPRDKPDKENSSISYNEIHPIKKPSGK